MDTALAVPDGRLHASWCDALRDFGTSYPHGSGLDPDAPPTLDARGCETFAAARRAYADPRVGPPPGKVACTYFWLLEADEVVGFLAVRHTLDASLLDRGGHIGYSVRPSARRRGHAARGLRLGLAHAGGLGLDRVLLTCPVDNEASRRTIEGAGGAYEDTRAGQRRYWFGVGAAGGDGAVGGEPVSAAGAAPGRG